MSLSDAIGKVTQSWPTMTTSGDPNPTDLLHIADGLHSTCKVVLGPNELTEVEIRATITNSEAFLDERNAPSSEREPFLRLRKERRLLAELAELGTSSSTMVPKLGP